MTRQVTIRPKVLVVDDDAASRNLVYGIGERSGCAVEGCGSVDEFKRLGSTEPYSLIILDLVLGEKVSSDAVLDILEAYHTNVPLVLVTGYVAGFLDVMETCARLRGLKVIAKIEKRRNLFKLENLLRDLAATHSDMSRTATGWT